MEREDPISRKYILKLDKARRSPMCAILTISQVCLPFMFYWDFQINFAAGPVKLELFFRFKL